MRNLWDKDRKTIYKELYSQYLKEGYSNKEAKRYASEETDEICTMDEDFIKDIFEKEEE